MLKNDNKDFSISVCINKYLFISFKQLTRTHLLVLRELKPKLYTKAGSLSLTILFLLFIHSNSKSNIPHDYNIFRKQAKMNSEFKKVAIKFGEGQTTLSYRKKLVQKIKAMDFSSLIIS